MKLFRESPVPDSGLGKQESRKAGYWSLLASALQVPSPPLCHFWKMLQPESDNRIKNIYSQAEKQSQIKLQGVPKNLFSTFGIKRNLKRASEIYNSLGVLVKKKGQSLLAKVTGLTSFMSHSFMTQP